MAYHQKIQCNVTECAHNSLEDSTCRLDKIQVSTGRIKNKELPEDETACLMYSNSGYLNSEGARASRQV